MRRKLIISNAFLVFFSLLLLFITSLVVIVAINNINSKAEAKGYLYTLCEILMVIMYTNSNSP